MTTWSICCVRRPLGRRGFTLVELLVVVAIIGVLMGLLLPAVNSARRRARTVQCVNRQKELATAIILYDQAKNRLPGYVNRVGPTNTIVSWVPMLFPYMGKMDFWEGSAGWRNGVANAANSPYIEQLVCPDDVEATGTPRLSYVVNVGLYTQRDYRWDPTIPGNISPTIFRNYSGGSAGAKSLSDVRSQSQTIMLGEYHDPARLWSTVFPSPPPTDGSVERYLGFVWPDRNVPALQPAMIGKDLPVISTSFTLFAPLQSVHTGVVIAAFCDGHVEQINNEALCSEYRGSL